MKSARPAHRCSECGYASAKWVGRCPECQAWGSLQEVGAPAGALRAVSAGPVTAPARPIAQVELAGARAVPTGIAEFDRVLGGGLVPGAVLLVAGEPGVGKSTLLLEVAHRVAETNGPALVVSGEESAGQVRLRAERIGALHERLYLAAETELSAVLGHIEQVNPTLLILDSVQTVRSPGDGTDGGATQVRAVASALTAVSKTRGMTTILVGHVTKDGAIAGPRTLEHLVDVVISFDGERHSTLRLVRAVKNRFGPADEIGCFEIGDAGVVGVSDPSALFVSRRTAPVAGSCVTVTLEGSRPLLAEVQALVAEYQRRRESAAGGQRAGQPAGRHGQRRRRAPRWREAGRLRRVRGVRGRRADRRTRRRPRAGPGDRLRGQRHPAAGRLDRPRGGRAVRRDPPGRGHRTTPGRGRPPGVQGRAGPTGRRRCPSRHAPGRDPRSRCRVRAFVLDR